MAYWAAVCAFILTGCSDNHSTDEKIFTENVKEELEEEKMEESEVESSGASIETNTEDSTDSIVMEPEIAYADWSEYSNGLNGAAVVYDATNRRYTMGKAEGVVVDAWFTGFAESTEGNIYFCVHLGRTDGMNVSSPRAKEIAIQIVSDYYDHYQKRIRSE